MAVIYLPQAIGGIGPSLNSLGALGGAYLGNKLEQNHTADVLAEAGKLQDPTAKANYIMAHMPGKQGLDLVQTLSDMQRTASATKRDEAMTAHDNALTSLTQQQSARYDHTQDLEDRVQQAKIKSEEALTAGRTADVAKTKIDLEIAEDQLRQHRAMQPRIDQLLSDGVSGSTAPTPIRPLTPGDIQPPSGSGGAASAGPRSDAVPPDQRAAVAQKASAATGVPAALIHGLVDYETGGSWRTGITNKDTGAMGLAQALPTTAKDPGFGIGPFPAKGTAEQQATWAAQYLKARGSAAGVTDWNDPAQQSVALAAYHGPQTDANGVNGETYAKNVLDRAGQVGAATQSPSQGGVAGQNTAVAQSGRGPQGQEAPGPAAPAPGAGGASGLTPAGTAGFLASNDLSRAEIVPQLNQMLFQSGPMDTSGAQMQLQMGQKQAQATRLLAMEEYSPTKQAEGLARAQEIEKRAQDMYTAATAPIKGTKVTTDLPGAPGVKITTAQYPDGKTRIIGIPNDTRKLMPNAEQLSDALSQWYSQTEAARQFGQNSSVQPGEDSTLKRLERGLNQRLNDFGMAPIQFTSTDPAFNAEAATFGHNMIAAIAMTKGGGRGKAMTEMFQNLTPKPTDGPEVRTAKVDASDNVVKIRVKNLVENAQEGGQRVPPSMRFIYDKYDLGKRSMDELVTGYVQNTVKAGGKPIDPNDPQEGEIPVSPAYRQSIEHPQAIGSASRPTFENGKTYQDANGNKATYQDGKWVPVP